MAVLNDALVTRHQSLAGARRRALQRRHAARDGLCGRLVIVSNDQRVEDPPPLTLWDLASVAEGYVAWIVVPLLVSRSAGWWNIVGAHRPSVTTATGALAKAGRVGRRDDGDCLLHGDPPEKLRHERLAAALS